MSRKIIPVPNKRIKDLTGKIISRITVVGFVGISKHGKSEWLCLCSCGKEFCTDSRSIISEKTKSCGCLQAENRTSHGRTHTPEYMAWKSIIQRCTNNKHPQFKYWGGRGITVCNDWLMFEKFFADMGKRPTKDHSLDRIDNSQGYSKSNCRWATRKQQANNKRSNKQITWRGETHTISEWADKLNIPRKALTDKLSRLPVEQVLSKYDSR